MIQPTDDCNTSFRRQISVLYRDRGIMPDSSFACSALEACDAPARRRGSRFDTGNWPYIGEGYGSASVAGRLAKILFVAMDRGGKGGGANEPFEKTQYAFRHATEVRANPHMGGVAAILTALVDECDPMKYSRIFALTNAVKCTEHTGSMRTRTTATMISQCSAHLRCEINSLDPDIVITQGGHPAATAKRLLEPITLARYGATSGRNRAVVWRAAHRLLLTTPHPARVKGFAWKWGTLPDYLAAAIERIRAEHRDGAAA